MAGGKFDIQNIFSEIQDLYQHKIPLRYLKSNGFIFVSTVITDMKIGIINFHALARFMS